jgi:lipoprotein-anchoring transpeptidase ErfK/SrfK
VRQMSNPPSHPQPGQASICARRPRSMTLTRRAAWWPMAVALSVALLVSACAGGGSPTAASGSGSHSHAHHSAPANPLHLAITPGTGSRWVNPAKGITVTTGKGTLTNVSVQSQGDPVAGTMNAASTSWHSTYALDVSTRYTVTATARVAGSKPVTETSVFTTLTPARTFRTLVFEGQGDTYGVGMPIILDFSEPIVNRAAVESALQVQTSKPVVGAWYWDNSQTLYFRPRTYWPAGTTVSFTGHLNGVEGAPGLFGFHTLTQSFKIGEPLIVIASPASHHMLLYKNGKLYARWPISAGKPGDDTPNGTYLTVDKGNPVLMKGPGYAVEVNWSVRFTYSGDYLHSAPWSVGSQGFTNVSHGCINMPPADAEIYYKMEVPGDPVTVTGSPRGGVWDNGWTQWFLSWPQLVQGSALHEAVVAGPHGSTFVSPETLTAVASSSPLVSSQPGNSNA